MLSILRGNEKEEIRNACPEDGRKKYQQSHQKDFKKRKGKEMDE